MGDDRAVAGTESRGCKHFGAWPLLGRESSELRLIPVVRKETKGSGEERRERENRIK